MCVWLYKYAHLYRNLGISTVFEEELKVITKGMQWRESRKLEEYLSALGMAHWVPHWCIDKARPASRELAEVASQHHGRSKFRGSRCHGFVKTCLSPALEACQPLDSFLHTICTKAVVLRVSVYNTWIQSLRMTTTLPLWTQMVENRSLTEVLTWLLFPLTQGRICRKAGKSKKSFSRKEAEATFKSLVKTHEKYGWVTPPVSDGWCLQPAAWDASAASPHTQTPTISSLTLSILHPFLLQPELNPECQGDI